MHQERKTALKMTAKAAGDFKGSISGKHTPETEVLKVATAEAGEKSAFAAAKTVFAVEEFSETVCL